MRQYFANESLEIGDEYTFDDSQAHHLKNVLRMKENDLVRIVDERGRAYLASLQFNDSKVIAKILEKSLEENVTSEIVCCAAMIKKDKWELMIQKACELGATTIVPLETARTIIHLGEKDIAKKLERWNKIALEASQQANRTTICKIEAPIKLKDITKYKQDINIVAYENENTIKLKDLISDGSICFVVGPEGGFEGQEITYLEEVGFKTCSLGKRILRAETASMYVLSVIEAIRG